MGLLVLVVVKTNNTAYQALVLVWLGCGKMEDEQKLKITRMKDDQHGRRSKWKTSKMEDEPKERRAKGKTSKMEDVQNVR